MNLKNPDHVIIELLRHQLDKSEEREKMLKNKLKLAIEVLQEFELGHEHNESCDDYRPLGDAYGYCSLCHTKVSLNEDLARDTLKEIKDS